MKKIINYIIITLLVASFAAAPLTGASAQGFQAGNTLMGGVSPSAAAAVVVPTPISPSGNVSDTTPTYTFSRVTGATQYQYQLLKGAALVYTKTIASTACGAGVNCVNTPANVLPYAAYTWKVRAYVSGIWQAFSAAKTFNLTNVPTPISPSGAIIPLKPTYTFTKIQGASQYQYQLLKGTTLVYTKTIAYTACGTGANCVNTPTNVLSPGAYSWKVRAYVGGAWKAFSAAKAFTVVRRFNSQFTSDAAGWIPVNGSWSVGGGYYQTGGISGLSVSSVHSENYPILTYTVRIFRSGGAASSLANYVYFRGSPSPVGPNGDWNNGYRFNITNDGWFSFGYQQNGTWHTVIDWFHHPAVTSGWNVLQVTINDNFCQLFINGTRVAYGTLNAFTTGQVGVGYFRGAINETFSVDYATLVASAPLSASSVSGLSAEGINWDFLNASGPASNSNPNGH